VITVPVEAIKELAEAHRVCVRPVLHQVLDTESGRVHLVPTPCGATLASKCAPCAHKNRLLRMQQCREGWHLEQEPSVSTKEAADDQPVAATPRRVRSTRRRQDAPELPTLAMDKRTVGTAFTTPSGKTYRPSMFVTFTLPSYGAVRSDGTPVDPSRYDYRQAALDALHFPKLVDRVWQNLRRVTGYQVQYFASVEAQRRLAPHLHAAIRGAVPRDLLRQVAEATYHQVWWPEHGEPVYADDVLPVWVDGTGYVDPETLVPLPSWDAALDSVDADPEATPAHTLRLGRQLDIQGIIASEGDADRRVAYLTKYLAKSIGDSYGSADEITRRQHAHQRRLHEEVRFLPCSARCTNWLRFGIQPQGADEGMRPGECPSKAHDRQHLGCGGRRVLVSRRWTGKTLGLHRADRAEVVRQTLLAAGVQVPEVHRLSATLMRADGWPRFEWKLFNQQAVSTPIYRQVMTRAIAEKIRWEQEYAAAKERAAWANAPPRPPDSQPKPVRGTAGQG
jgi:hypothetical protein